MEDATVHEARLLLGRYRVERVLGGGMGVVYVAQDTHFDRKVAVKTIRPALAPDATQARELLLRFEREKVAHERVGNHPNLVTVYDFAIYRDPEPTPYLVLEYVAGGALSDRLQQGPVPLDIALRYTADIARGLGVAHAKQIVHRDIKPGNIFLATDGRAQVGDFGIAQVGDLSGRDDDATRRHPGTPLYMSPEQETKPGYLRPTSDEYSVGLVFFEMLTCESYKQLSLRHLEERLAAMPPAVAALIRKMTAPDPDARFESMAQVHREIVAVYRSLQLAPPDDDYSTQMVFQASPQQWETPPSGSGNRFATPPGVPSARPPSRPAEPTAVDGTPPPSVGEAASADATLVDEPAVRDGKPPGGSANPSTDSLAEMQRQITELRQQMAADEERRKKEDEDARRRREAEEEEERRQEAERVAQQLREVAEQQRRTEAAEKAKREQEAEAANRLRTAPPATGTRTAPPVYPHVGAAPPVYPHVGAPPPTYPPVYPPVYPPPPRKKGSFGRRLFLLLLLAGGGTAGYLGYRKYEEAAATRTPSPSTRTSTPTPTTPPTTTRAGLSLPPTSTAPPSRSRHAEAIHDTDLSGEFRELVRGQRHLRDERFRV
jgi:serine/threonine protein kinase